MQKEEAVQYKSKRIRVLIQNGFKFSGEVLEVTADTLVIRDKFGEKVSIRLADIMLCSEEVRL